ANSNGAIHPPPTLKFLLFPPTSHEANRFSPSVGLPESAPLYRESLYAAGRDPSIIERVKTLTSHSRPSRQPAPAVPVLAAAAPRGNSAARLWLLAFAGAALLWLAQPPL